MKDLSIRTALPRVVIADAKILILKQITTIKLAYAKQAHELITKATLINPNEPSKDHPHSDKSQ